MEDYDVRSAASILASVKEQEERFEQLTRALEEERRNVTLQLERANLPPNPAISQPLAWQQVVMQVNDTNRWPTPPPTTPQCLPRLHLTRSNQRFVLIRRTSSLLPSEQAHLLSLFAHGHHFFMIAGIL